MIRWPSADCPVVSRFRGEDLREHGRVDVSARDHSHFSLAAHFFKRSYGYCSSTLDHDFFVDSKFLNSLPDLFFGYANSLVDKSSTKLFGTLTWLLHTRAICNAKFRNS